MLSPESPLWLLLLICSSIASIPISFRIVYLVAYFNWFDNVAINVDGSDGCNDDGSGQKKSGSGGHCPSNFGPFHSNLVIIAQEIYYLNTSMSKVVSSGIQKPFGLPHANLDVIDRACGQGGAFAQDTLAMDMLGRLEVLKTYFYTYSFVYMVDF